MVDVGGHANPLQGILEALNVTRADAHDRVRLARHGAGIDDFGHGREDAPQLVRRDRSAAEELHIRLDGEPVDGRVDLHGEGADHLVGDELVDAAFHCGGRETDFVADVAVSCTGVLAQLVDDAVVDCVHAPRLRRNRA